jgi:DNA repair exonuclease SbcCD nuclease subunit
MKYLLLSDIHFSDKQPVGRIDDIYQAGLEKLNIIFSYACSERIPILQAGDLFDSERNWKCLNDIINLFNKYEWLKENFHCVYGNHDMFKINKNDTCLNVLENIGYVNILDHEKYFYDLNGPNESSICGVSWGDTTETENADIIVIHKSISDNETMFDTESAKGFVTNFSNTLILCGHIHDRFVADGGNNSRIINTGPIIKRRITEKDHKPCYAVLETETGCLKWYFLPDKAEFSKEHIELKKEQERSKIDLEEYIKSLGQFKKTSDFKEKLMFVLSNMNDEPVKHKIESFLK